jgi:hypothetical protein
MTGTITAIDATRQTTMTVSANGNPHDRSYLNAGWVDHATQPPSTKPGPPATGTSWPAPTD